MSKCVILFDDDKTQCKTLLHSKKMMTCLNPDCLTYPQICCSDCIEQLHQHKGNSMTLEKSQFVNQTNKKYSEIQEQVYALEAEYQNFEKKGSNLKRLFNGDIERMRIQLNKIIDSLKEQINKQIDLSISTTKKQVTQKIEKTKDALQQFKPINISKIYNDQLKRLINAMWHTDYKLERDQLKIFFPNLQEKLRGKLSQINDSVSQELVQLSQELIQESQEEIQSFIDQRTPNDNLSTQSDESIVNKLVNLRDSLKLQMEQHLAAKNCTHKGCHQVTPVKAYYGYYYHISGYALQGELPISVCAKSKKLAEKMDRVVNDLYKLQYRDSTIDDCVQAYFIY
ncbi:unnamed protein product [Paramecium pentaurelia]|uniref:Uncharacterized protein n=1 Tax=Paramecium pentaurelia TaxID=43138 RepID=A0A8S1VRH4_9CILI|nr:unnamed protein product [Paramecium pentaurelia]